MNENLNLCEILKHARPGLPLYSSVYGDVLFFNVDDNNQNNPYPITVLVSGARNTVEVFTKDGRVDGSLNGEEVLFPSREQRDWAQFVLPGEYDLRPEEQKIIRKPKEEYRPFERVLVSAYGIWTCDFFSHVDGNGNLYMLGGCRFDENNVIPYEGNKFLVGQVVKEG